MSIEQKIDALTAAITALTAALGARAPVVVAQPVEAPATKTAQLDDLTERVIKPAVAQLATAMEADGFKPTAPVMPPPPTFIAPVEPPKPAAPFTDAKGMIQYVTEAYKAMGPTKGARIQEVITSIGVVNINEIVPDHYAALYAGVEALKHGA